MHARVEQDADKFAPYNFDCLLLVRVDTRVHHWNLDSRFEGKRGKYNESVQQIVTFYFALFLWPDIFQVVHSVFPTLATFTCIAASSVNIIN